ncbi:hypothetical protein SNE40_007648 [Patella caerulea]|uniref:receptor protein-tyrosine kinase n=1 Tax=Patella caerulea TaxID=87958 RepID=A0AAN8K094_PATCE
MYDKLLKYRRSSEYTGTVKDDDNSSMVYLRWNTVESDGSPTSIPLAFIISLKSRFEGKESEWKTVAFTNFSFVPITGLSPAYEYNFQITAVERLGIIDEPKASGWTKIPKALKNVDKPVGLMLVKQYVKGKSVHAVVKWDPGENGGCYFKMYWMRPKSGKYKTQEIKEWSKYEMELEDLAFNTNYTVEVYTYDKDFVRSSKAATTTFSTLDCLNSTNHNYQICAPDRLLNLSGTIGPTYKVDDQVLSDVTLRWALPSYVSATNPIDHIVLIWRKEPPIHLSKYIAPHHDDLILPKDVKNVTIRGLHWNSVYAITTQIRSKGGISRKFTVHAVLGYAYNKEQYNENYSDLILIPKNEQPNSALPETNGTTSLYYLFLIPAILSIIAVVLALICRRQTTMKHKPRQPWPSRGEEINPIYETSRCPELFTDDKSLLGDEYELDVKRLTLSEAIGEGAFGRVFKATMSPEEPTKSSTGKVVAVKILRAHALPEERRNLLLEIDAMKQLGHHQNLISIIACCTTGPEICLIMDYCPLGDLRNYLRSFRQTPSIGYKRNSDSGISHAGLESNEHRHDVDIDDKLLSVHLPYPSKCDTEPSKDADFNPTTLLSYARQIVMGMEYLTEKKFVHRDLATRNILLSTKQLLKITDFGLTRDVYETNMYQPTSSRKLPYKWMPLETIFDQVFTVKSDVWSFGIVLWEIVTLGGCPYPGIPNENLFKLLKDGYRMEKPDNCGQELYQMMLACWHPTPSNRPTFKQLRLKLERLLEATQPYIDLSVMISDDYYQPDNSASNDTLLQNNTGKLSFKCDDHSWPPDSNIDQQERYIELPKTTTSLSGLPSHAQGSAHPSSEHVINGKWTGKGKAKSSFELRNISCPRTKCSRETNLNGNCSKSKLNTTPYSRIPIKISRSYNDVSDSIKRKKRSKPGQRGSGNVDNSDAHEHLNVSHESSSNLTCSEGVGSGDIDSSFSSLNYSKSVFHTPSLKHGLLNLLSRVGRRRLGNSDWRKSFSLTEVSNIHMANNADIKLGSTSAIV